MELRSMKKLVLLLLVLTTISVISAQLRWSDSLPVRQGVNIEWSRASEPTPDGGMVYVWSDTRNSDRDLWAQKVDNNGNLLWGNEGILVNGEINRQEDPVVIGTGDGSVIIAWVDFRFSDDGDIYAQKLDSNGNKLWANAGVPLCLASDIQISLNIVSDSDGGAYVIWIDSRGSAGSDIYGTHVDANGNIVNGWDADGNVIISESGEQSSHTFWEDGTGGAIVAWCDQRIDTDPNLYMQRISSNGTLLWNASGEVLTNATGNQESPKMCPDGTGNFIFAWRDRGTDEAGNIHAQRVDLNGNLLWSNELIVYAGVGVQDNVRVTTASDDGAILVWEDGRNEISDSYTDIYAQKINTSGNLLWDTDGVEVAIALNKQINPRLDSDDNGGAWVTWEDGRSNTNYPFNDIYVQHLNSSGAAQLAANGVALCDETNYQFSPLIKKNGNSIYAVWGDIRTGSTGIYIQILNTAGAIQLDNNGELVWYGLEGDANNLHVIENGSSPILLWEDTRFASIANQIYMQVVNSNGSFGLEVNGEPITEMTGYTQTNIDVYKNPDVDLIVTVWEENRSSERQVYAQAVDSNANSLWNSLGIRLCSEDIEQYNAHVSYDDGYYYTGWTNYNGDIMFPVIKVTGQKIDANGNLLWGNDGIDIADLDSDDVLTDVVGRYYIWQNESWPDRDIYCKLVDEDGNTAPGWEDNGNLICGAAGNQKDATGMMTPLGLLIIWTDSRDDVTNALDIYGQIITEDGTTLWQDDGVPLVSIAEDQYLANYLYNDGLVMAWDDFRLGNYDVYMQKYNEDGNGIFTTNGLPVITGNANYESPYITMNGDQNRYMIFWEDYLSGTESNLKANVVSDEGLLLWPDAGFMIDNGIKNQKIPMAVSNGDYAYVFWQDTRSSGKTDIYNIYAQKVEYVDEIGVENHEIPQEFTMLRQNYPNPFKTSTEISFNIDVHSLQNAEVKIYNIRGQQIRSLKIESNSIVWDGKDNAGKTVTSGLYFYKLQAKGVDSKAKKMILLK